MGQISDIYFRKKSILKPFDYEIMKPLFDIFEKTKGVKQMEIHYPEGDVFNHSLQVMQKAFRETTDTDLILAAMLHDVGKIVDSKGHEKIAVEWLGSQISYKTSWLIEQHMRIWYLILGKMRKLSKVKELAGHPWLPELVLLARWDKMGRNPKRKITFNKLDIIDRLNKCVEIRFKENQIKRTQSVHCK